MFQTNAELFFFFYDFILFIYFFFFFFIRDERKKKFKNYTRTGNLIIKYISRYQGFIGRIDSVCQCQCITYAHRLSQIDVAFAPIPSRLKRTYRAPPPPPPPRILLSKSFLADFDQCSTRGMYLREQ